MVAFPNDEPEAEHIGPVDAAHRAVRDVREALRAGQVAPAARKALSGDLAAAERPKPSRNADGTHKPLPGRATALFTRFNGGVPGV